MGKTRRQTRVCATTHILPNETTIPKLRQSHTLARILTYAHFSMLFRGFILQERERGINSFRPLESIQTFRYPCPCLSAGDTHYQECITGWGGGGGACTALCLYA